MSEILRRALIRFGRAFLAGAFATMATVMPLSGGWSDLGSWLSALGLSFVIGGIAGAVQAGDKYFRDSKE